MFGRVALRERLSLLSKPHHAQRNSMGEVMKNLSLGNRVWGRVLTTTTLLMGAAVVCLVRVYCFKETIQMNEKTQEWGTLRSHWSILTNSQLSYYILVSLWLISRVLKKMTTLKNENIVKKERVFGGPYHFYWHHLLI